MENKKEITPDNKTLPLFFDLEKYLKETKVFTNSNFCIKDLAQTFEKKECIISEAIKSAGFTGFKEYLNIIRLEYFKILASQKSQITVKELMFASGFTSRTIFYRVFSEQYGISPIKFINNQKMVDNS